MSKPEKRVGRNAGLPQDRSHRSFGKIARVIRKSGPATRLRIQPDLMASLGMSIECESGSSESSNEFAVAVAPESPHQEMPIGMAS